MDTVSPKPLEAVAIPTLLDRAAARFADRPAMSFEGRRWSYAQLAELVERATAGLQRIGLKRGEKLGLCLPNCPYFVIFYYAALKAGLVAVNYNPLYVTRELRHQIDDSATTTMIVPDLAAIYDKVASIGSLRRIVVCRFASVLPRVKAMAFSLLRRRQIARPVYGGRVIGYDQVAVAGAAPKPVEIDRSEVAVLQYTGGTTGRPKGGDADARQPVDQCAADHASLAQHAAGRGKVCGGAAVFSCLRDDLDPERRSQHGL
jgi:long-chain acyl-CoA synthetase